MANYLYFEVCESAVEMGKGDPIQQGRVEITGTSGQSAAISGSGRKRRAVRLWADVDCFVLWGANPTALQDGTGGQPYGASNPEWREIEAGHVIATIEKV